MRPLAAEALHAFGEATILNPPTGEERDGLIALVHSLPLDLEARNALLEEFTLALTLAWADDRRIYLEAVAFEAQFNPRFAAILRGSIDNWDRRLDLACEILISMMDKIAAVCEFRRKTLH